MNTKHWVFLAVVFIVGYLIGVKWPAFGSSALGSIPSVSV